MKKWFVLFSLALMVLCMNGAFAEDLGVQIIGGPQTQMVAMSLDDMQVGSEYTIDGYAKVAPKEFLIVDYFAQFNKDADYAAVTDSYNKDYVYYQEQALKGKWANYYKQASWMDSGLNADFVWFQLDVTNLQKKSVSFMDEMTVKLVYADEYEFAGWIRQANFDYNTAVYRWNSQTTGAPFAVIDSSNEEAVDMMYTGTFIIGCTVPNSVVEDKKSPLRIEIKMGENDLTYHIRK